MLILSNNAYGRPSLILCSLTLLRLYIVTGNYFCTGWCINDRPIDVSVISGNEFVLLLPRLSHGSANSSMIKAFAYHSLLSVLIPWSYHYHPLRLRWYPGEEYCRAHGMIFTWTQLSSHPKMRRMFGIRRTSFTR